MKDFLERHGLICVKTDDDFDGLQFIWSFPGLKDWVMKTYEGKRSVLLCKSFNIFKNVSNEYEIRTSDLEDFYCSTPLDYMELSEKIKKLTIEYKNTKIKLMEKEIKHDFH